MNNGTTIKATLQCISDHLPENDYECYFHNQASEFSIESRIVYESAPASGRNAQKVTVEFILPDGKLTLEGYGINGYAALRDALNVYDLGKSALILVRNAP